MFMVISAFKDFISQPFVPFIISASLFLSLVCYHRWKDRHGIQFGYLLGYAHIFFISFPFFLFASYLPCTMDLLSGLSELCSIALTKLIIILAPIALVLALAFCFFVAPRLYLRRIKAKESSSGRAFSIVEMHAPNLRMSKLRMSIPRLFIDPDPRPLAFSFANPGARIVISQGLLDALTAKELEAVILHEIGHIKNRSSFAKISTLFVQWFSPLSHFARFGFEPAMLFFAEDEARADGFAVQVQGSRRYIESARRKCTTL